MLFIYFNRAKPFFFIILLLLCGCHTDQKTKYATSSTLADNTAIHIDTLWSKKIGKKTDEYYLKLVPAIDKESIFVASSAGNIRALSKKSGATLWKKDIQLLITGGLSVGYGQLLLGSSEGDVLALDPKNGKELWRANISGEILVPPQQQGDIVVIRTADGKLVAIDAINGKQLWSYSATVPTLTLRGTSRPVLSGSLIIAGFDSGKLSVLERSTGKTVWEYMVSTEHTDIALERLSDIDATPIVADGVIYFATVQDQFIALDLATADPLWSRKIGSYTDIAIDDTRLYITDKESHIWALDRLSGVSVWKQEALQDQQLTGPSVADTLIVVGSQTGDLFWLDKYSGTLIARNKISRAQIQTTPVIIDQTLYVYANNGTIGSYTYRNLSK